MEPHHLYKKALKSGRLSEEEEAIIASDAEYAYLYARDVIKGRWSEGEPIIATSAGCAYCYARDVIGGRWLEGEPIIMANARYACYYVTHNQR